MAPNAMPRLLARSRFATLVVVAAIASAPLAARAAPRSPLRVGVLDFENVSNDHSLDPLGKGLQSFLTTDLSQTEALQLVERSRLADVQRELKLAHSGAVDARTAARIGKLLGASHLLAGTFTVLGDRLRIDCRLFAVESGAILLAEKSEGDKDAFFEVEKSLVKRVLEVIEVQPKPKERAAIMKPQTADFEAFRAFSRGLELFDQKRYDEAIAALKDARKRDQDFKLAEVTQTEYEQVIAGLRTEAAALATRDRAASRRAGQAASQVELDAIDKLYALAARKGTDARFERLAALGALATWFAHGRPQPSAPPAIPDAFTQHRVAGTALQAYVAEASALYPQVPLAPLSVPSDLMLQAGAFDAEFAKLVARYRAPSPGDLLRLPEAFAVLPADRADLHARLYNLVLKRSPPRDWQVKEVLELAREYRIASDFDRSTAYLKQAAALSEGADRKRALEDVANEIELNQQLSDALKKATAPARREMVEIAALSPRYELQQLSEYGTPHGWRSMRELPMTGEHGRGPVLLGKHPAWVFGLYDHALETGPRRGGLATSELRYYWEQTDRHLSELLAILDGAARGDLTAQFTVTFKPAADFSTHTVPRPSAKLIEAGIDPRRPGFGVIFGVTHPECCESVGYALMLLPDAVRLTRFVQNPSELKANEQYAQKVIEEQRIDLLGQGPTRVAVKVTDKAIEVTAGGRTVRLRAPPDHNGLYGFYFGGHGYVAVADVDFK